MGRDVEADVRARVAADARAWVRLLRERNTTTPDIAIDRLIDRAFGSPDRLRDAAELLGDEHREARALLVRATRLAADPQPPAPPRPFAPPDAPRL
jgi:hypothetical protein